MADKALPVIFFNLSGEMIYVIQQRLEAQNVSQDKSSKVIQDILNTMLNDQFIEELFKPQDMYSRSAMQSVFEKLVHSSIMRLNTTSMSKLYDLMLMVFKYQVLNCQYAEDILLVTLNHIDAIKNCSAPYQDLKKKVENVYFLIISNYKDISHLEYENLFHCVSAFLDDLNIRVSVLMRLGLQLPSGEIVRPESKNNLERSFCLQKKGQQNDIEGEGIQQMWKNFLPDDCFELNGNRCILLGTNIYTKSVSFQNIGKLSEPDSKLGMCNDNGKFQAIEEITLLGRLIGNTSQSEYVPDILFSSTDEDLIECNKNKIEKNDCSFVTIDASQKGQHQLGKISTEFLIENEKKYRNDILELLDSA